MASIAWIGDGDNDNAGSRGASACSCAGCQHGDGCAVKSLWETIFPPYAPVEMPRYPSVPAWTLTAAPVGCICPPGANKECERADCPRKETAV